jgi:hypothetical protein
MELTNKSILRILIITFLLGALSQSALAVMEKNHDYWMNYLLLPPIAIQSNQYLAYSFPAKESLLMTNGNNHKVVDNISLIDRVPTSYSFYYRKAYGPKPNRIDTRLLSFLDTLESLDTKSLELQIGESVLSSPSFYSRKSPELRLYSTSVDWKDPLYPEPLKLVLSVHRDRTESRRNNIPSAMVIMYTDSNPTRERTIIGYSRYGIYGTLTLLWDDSEIFRGTSFLQFGISYDSPEVFQPFYDPDLQELTYHRRGQWIAAGWRTSDLSSLKILTKYLYYLMVGE